MNRKLGTTLLLVVFVAIATLLYSAFAPSMGTAVVADNNESTLGNAAPYTRYPRFVQTGEGCGAGNGVVYNDTSTSNGGNTYSEMHLIFADGESGCPVVVVTPVVVTPVARRVVEDKAVPTTTAVVVPITTPAPTLPVVETPVVVDPTVVVVEDDTCDNANPGNLKCVGNAGENPNGKDTMPLDSGSLEGNGQHGNQGKGGNSNK